MFQLEQVCHFFNVFTTISTAVRKPHRREQLMAKKVRKRADVARFLDEVEFHDAALLSYVTSAIIVPAYSEVKREFGIIRAEYLLLLCLSHFPVLTAQDVSTLTGRPRNSISRAVNRMLNEGYIKRVPDPEDGRQAKLSIRAAGRKLHSDVAAFLVTHQEKVLSVLTTTERKTLEKLLRKTAIKAAEDM